MGKAKNLANTADWISFVDNKLIACVAGVERLVPATDSKLTQNGVTHELLLSSTDIVQPQEMVTLIDDGHGEGIRLVLTTDHLYRWVATHRRREKMILLVSQIDEYLQPVQDALASASELRILINGEVVSCR